jgi:hypothetical protein
MEKKANHSTQVSKLRTLYGKFILHSAFKYSISCVLPTNIETNNIQYHRRIMKRLTICDFIYAI